MRGRLNRPLLLALGAVFVLVAVVAVASTGSTPAGTGDTRRPHELLLDTFISLGMVALIPAAAIFIYGLTQRKAIAEEMASGRYRRASTVGLLVFVGVATGLVYLLRRNDGLLPFTPFGGTIGFAPDGNTFPQDPSQTDPDAYRAKFAWIPVLVILGLIAACVVAFTIASRRGRALGEDDVVVAEQLADVLEDTLDDLRAEPDPRRVVIAAYARLERSFAAAGVPRRQEETAVEYVPRALDGLDVDPAAVRKLTDLFTTAKFSQHPVDDGMKRAAISALERIRDDLRAAAAARAEQAAREPELPGQAATP